MSADQQHWCERLSAKDIQLGLKQTPHQIMQAKAFIDMALEYIAERRLSHATAILSAYLRYLDTP